MGSVAQSAVDANEFLGIFVPPTSAYLTPSVVLEAVSSLGAAAAAAADPFRLRLETLWLAPTYVALLRWNELKAWAAANSFPWPLKAAAADSFADFSGIYTAAGLAASGRGALSEGGHDLAWLQSQLPTL